MIKTKSIINAINLPKKIADHTVGELHSHAHRMFFGTLVMTIGVVLAKAGNYFGSSSLLQVVFHYSLDVIGYLFHGIGAIPFIEKIIHNKH